MNKPTITIDLTDARSCDVGTTSHDGRQVGYVRIGEAMLYVELPLIEDLQRRTNETLDGHAEREESYNCEPFCDCNNCLTVMRT